MFLLSFPRGPWSGAVGGERGSIRIAAAIHDAAAPRINAGWPAYEAALKAANVKHTMDMYPGTQHGFNNHTTPRYDERSAQLTWQRMLEFFNKTLR